MMSPRDCIRQDHSRQAWRLDAVGGRHRRGTRADRGAGHLRCRRVAEKSGGEIYRAAGCAFRRRGGGRARSAQSRPHQSCPFLSVARDVSGSQGYSRSRTGEPQAGARGTAGSDGARRREHPDRASRAGAERPRQSGDRNQQRFAVVESAGLRAPREVGGSAREIQERRIRHHLAADRAAAHRDHGGDAGVARGQGLFRRGQTRQRSGSRRYSAGPETCDIGVARPGGRGTRARQGRAEPIQDCRGIHRPGRRGRSQAARHHAAAEARRSQPGRRLARTRDAFGDVARRLDRGEGAAINGADLFRDRTLRRVACGGQDRDQAAAQFGNIAAGPGRGSGPVCATVSRSEGRRSSAGRRARDIL